MEYEYFYEDFAECENEDEAVEMFYSKIRNGMENAIQYPYDISFEDIKCSKTVYEKACKESQKFVKKYWQKVFLNEEKEKSFYAGKQKAIFEIVSILKSNSFDITNIEQKKFVSKFIDYSLYITGLNLNKFAEVKVGMNSCELEKLLTSIQEKI